MSEESFPDKGSPPGGGIKPTPTRTSPYTAKDLQLEILGELAEMRALTEALHESLVHEAKERQEPSRLLSFDGRTLVAVGAIALSMTGYVLQDARNTSKRDAEIETTKVRVTNLERIAAVNTEGRIRTEVQLGELREGQVEIKSMILAHDSASKKGPPRK